jgi:RNA polymerase sigma factor (TIGR02999 family)
MNTPTPTEMLLAWNDGDNSAFDKLVPLVEKELRHIAARYMRHEKNNHTLQTTALVNEAYLRLVKQDAVRWQSRSHFFAVASQIMRRILLDFAKAKYTQKRGGNGLQVELDDSLLVSKIDIELVIAIDEALKHLQEFDPLKSKIVELRHFGGLSVEETAESLGLAPVTVMRHWRLAKAWLETELTR